MNAHQRRIAKRKLARAFPVGSKVKHVWCPDGIYIVVDHTERAVGVRNARIEVGSGFLFNPSRLTRIP